MSLLTLRAVERRLRKPANECAGHAHVLTLLNSSEPKGEDTKFNFYTYYDEEDLVAGKHDKFVLGKIARVLYAYRALAKVITVEDQ
jgi:hypothetical protein